MTTNAGGVNTNAKELAFLGDCVYELFVREELTALSAMGKARGIQTLAVKRVRAEYQSDLYERLEPLLTKAEADILRRGRNISPRNLPKAASQTQYRRATAVETLFGYLWHIGERDRARELYEKTKTDRRR